MKVFSLNLGLLILRLASAAIILPHGWQKLTILLDGRYEGFLDPIGLGALTSLILSTTAEFLCAIFIVFGAFTRICAFVLTVNMAVAMYYLSTIQGGMDAKQLVFALESFYLVLVLTGAGKFSLDQTLLDRIPKLSPLTVS